MTITKGQRILKKSLVFVAKCR